MTCSTVALPGGGAAIVCTSGRRRQRRCLCGHVASLECDWKMPGPLKRGKQVTCDAPLCPDCTSSPAPGKDLCAEHAKAWAVDPRNPKVAR